MSSALSSALSGSVEISPEDTWHRERAGGRGQVEVEERTGGEGGRTRWWEQVGQQVQGWG